MWDEITYPFPNFNSATVEVWDWISTFIPHIQIWQYGVSPVSLKFNLQHFPWNIHIFVCFVIMWSYNKFFADIFDPFIYVIQGPISLTFFHHNSNSMEISFSCNSITGDHIATKFGTCHDSPAVVPCAKYCSDHYIIIWMRANWNFHHICIVMEKLLVKWAPGLLHWQLNKYIITPVPV